jgi:hypothetical protein
MTYRNYTAAQYRVAGINAGPYALEGNPDPEKRNYRTFRRKSILGVVMHITAGMTDYSGPDTSAEATTRYGADTTRDASWHVCIDSDGIIPSVRDAYTAWHAGVIDIANVNDATLGIEQGTGQVDWRKAPDAWVDRTIRNVAVWLAPRVIKYQIPLVLTNDRNAIEAAIIANRRFGFTSHKIISPSNRTDPGWIGTTDTYPWSMLFAYIRQEMALLTNPPTPPTEDWFDMATKQDLENVIKDLLVPNGAAITDDKAWRQAYVEQIFNGHATIPDTTTGVLDDSLPRVTASKMLEAGGYDRFTGTSKDPNAPKPE